MTWSTRPSLPAGHIVTADDIDVILDQIDVLSADWSTWTPTLTNLSGGTINAARYMQIGKTVHYRFKYTLAGAGVGTSPTFTLPVAPATNYTLMPIGDVDLTDTGTANRRGMCHLTSGSTVEILSYGTTGIATTTTATVPHTWANTDTICVSGTYEAA